MQDLYALLQIIASRWQLVACMYTAKCWCQNYESVSITVQAIYHLLSTGYKVSLTQWIWYCWPCRNSVPMYKEARSLLVPIPALASHQTFSVQNKYLSGQIKLGHKFIIQGNFIEFVKNNKCPYHKHWYMSMHKQSMILWDCKRYACKQWMCAPLLCAS